MERRLLWIVRVGRYANNANSSHSGIPGPRRQQCEVCRIYLRFNLYPYRLSHFRNKQHYMSGSVILAIDIGSSSIRCTAYDVSNQESHQYRVVTSQSQSRRSVQPGSGKIVLLNDNSTTLLDDIDVLVDQVLNQLHSVTNVTYNVIAVGFSSFVMNLVGVDVHGQWIGDHATLSYACSQSEVNTEVKRLKRCVRRQRIASFHYWCLEVGLSDPPCPTKDSRALTISYFCLDTK
jgi:hypothetical protein